MIRAGVHDRSGMHDRVGVHDQSATAGCSCIR